MGDDENTIYTIRVKNAFKSYGGKNVIDGLNMNIKSNSIYGLLGSSGCGKSTILQCILGVIQLDFGKIELKADSIIDIGYMPQDLCLDDILTIQESLEYYGALYKMRKEKIKSRICELSKFLKLPNMNIYIKNLSGGQCRRVSLAISLLHDSQIIILDEPTVGIDPLMRYEIWVELKRMVQQQQKTIIITTHYIEEANEANDVGLMRNGKLVEEGSTQDILHKYDTDSLESVFLKICFNQDANQMIQNGYHDIEQVKEKAETNNLKKYEKLIDFNRIKSLMTKNIRITCRDYYLFFTIIIIPIIQTVLVCIGIGTDMKALNVAIKNDEVNYFDCQNYKINGCIFDEDFNFNQTASCIIMNYYASLDYELIFVESNEDGEKKMMNSKYIAFIHFPHNYTKELFTFMDGHDDFDINLQPYIHVNTASNIPKNVFLEDLRDVLDLISGNLTADCKKNPKAFKFPIVFENIIGDNIKTYTNSIASEFLASIFIQFSGIYSCSMMMSERMDGIFVRSMFSGVTPLELVLSMFFIYNIFYVIQISSCLVIMFEYFSNPIMITSGLFAYFIQSVLLGWIGFLFGVLSACVMSSKVGAVYLMNGWLLSQFLISGIISPIESQPLFLRPISKLLPLSVSGITMTDVSLKGWSFDHPSISFGVIIMSMYTILLVFVLFVMSKLKKDMWVINK